MTQKKWWESSVDAGAMALRLKGILVGIVPVVILIAQAKGWDLGEVGLMAMVDVIVSTVASVGTLIGIAMTIYGYLRKK